MLRPDIETMKIRPMAKDLPSLLAWIDELESPRSTSPDDALDTFLREYEEDDNAWWVRSGGEHQNLFDELLDRVRECESLATTLRAAYSRGWRDGYESPEVEVDYEPMNPYDLNLTDDERAEMEA